MCFQCTVYLLPDFLPLSRTHTAARTPSTHPAHTQLTPSTPHTHLGTLWQGGRHAHKEMQLWQSKWTNAVYCRMQPRQCPNVPMSQCPSVLQSLAGPSKGATASSPDKWQVHGHSKSPVRRPLTPLSPHIRALGKISIKCDSLLKTHIL